MNEKNELTDIACQSLKLLTHFDEQSLFLSANADCIVHPMAKQITFINIFSQLKPVLVSNGLRKKIAMFDVVFFVVLLKI